MKSLVGKFLHNFYLQNRKVIWGSTIWRLFSFVQVLFWPYAISKIINILSTDVKNWRIAIPWLVAVIVNKATEDFIRLRIKHKIQCLDDDLEISLATFFSEKTNIREGYKTGEGVQRIKTMGDTINRMINFYKNSFLSIPVNLIIIPLIFFKLNKVYLWIFLFFIFLYLFIDHLTTTQYMKGVQKYFRASEVFWGTIYRKAPDIWRHREDTEFLHQEIDKEGKRLREEAIVMDNTNNWRWLALQLLSTIVRSLGIIVVFLRIIHGQSHVGDIVLVDRYLVKVQSTLNHITTTGENIADFKLSLQRLNEVVEAKN